MSEHPKAYLALRIRNRRRTLNLAVALKGRSTGWGRPGKPRRTFVGHHEGRPYHRAIELVLVVGVAHREHRLVRIPLGSGPAKGGDQ